MTARGLDVGVLFPELLDLHGDSANAEVLQTRAGWEGVAVTVTRYGLESRINGIDRIDGGPLGRRPDILIVGAAAEEDLPDAADALERIAELVRGWHARGTEVLAIGSGMDLLSAEFEISPGRVRRGLGLLHGRAPLLPSWASGTLVLASGAVTEGTWDAGPAAAPAAESRRSRGQENHARGYTREPDEAPLGAVRTGIGNGDGTEGVIRAGVTGTHLHGPVLANDPALADRLLDRVMRRRHSLRFESRNAQAAAADAAARLAQTSAGRTPSRGPASPGRAR